MIILQRIGLRVNMSSFYVFVFLFLEWISNICRKGC